MAAVKKRVKEIVVEGEQAKRLRALAAKWNVGHDEALRRALDQAFIGRGALVAAEGALIFLEHLATRKVEPKLSGHADGCAFLVAKAAHEYAPCSCGVGPRGLQ
jgi:hypothetical protein